MAPTSLCTKSPSQRLYLALVSWLIHGPPDCGHITNSHWALRIGHCGPIPRSKCILQSYSVPVDVRGTRKSHRSPARFPCALCARFASLHIAYPHWGSIAIGGTWRAPSRGLRACWRTLSSDSPPLLHTSITHRIHRPRVHATTHVQASPCTAKRVPASFHSPHWRIHNTCRVGWGRGAPIASSG